MSAYSRFARAIVSSSLRAMARTPERLEHEVLFILDEFAQLGHMDQIENDIAILHGYGALLWIFVQDLAQLRHVYRRWGTLMGNATWQFFGIQDMETAKFVSEALGQQTISVTTSGNSQNFGASRTNHGTSSHQTWIGRPLLTPAEVRRLDASTVIVFSRGQRPQRLQRLNYLTDPRPSRYQC